MTASVLLCRTCGMMLSGGLTEKRYSVDPRDHVDLTDPD